MVQLEGYYIVKRTEERDELFTTILAASLDEAHAIFKVRYETENEQMESGDAFYMFSEKKSLEFDDNNRLIFPKGKMASVERL